MSGQQPDIREEHKLLGTQGIPKHFNVLLDIQSSILRCRSQLDFSDENSDSLTDSA